LSNQGDVNGKIVTISITSVDKSTLPEDVRIAVGNRPVLQINVAIDGETISWNNPNAPVMISIPYVPTQEELGDPESIVVWYIDSNDQIIVVPNGNYNPDAKAVTCITTHLSIFAVAYDDVVFEDVPKDSWYEKAVKYIAARGITKGTGEGLFSPLSKLTRAQFITMIMRACNIQPDADPKENFSDAGDTWYTGYLAAAKRLGISQGVGNNLFAPGKDITRQEMFT
ncbi:MAG TPA: beta-xylosidase, partial [Clostridiales bacterium]|nr:beta-xylosidase [Clostridiales bacterium]